MSTFPKLAFMCPVPWAKMAGDEKERFCSRCSKTVVNLSTMTESQRQTVLANSRPEDLCVAYYRRLSGEFVSAENPLSQFERRGLKQFRVAALSAAALMVAASCAAGEAPIEQPAVPENESPAAADEKLGEVVTLLGMMPFTVDPAETPAADESDTSEDVEESASDETEI